MSQQNDATSLIGHLFRNYWGQAVSVLSRQFGIRNLETVEDAVQESLMAALRVWPTRGTPVNPQAWLYTVARNRLIDNLRSRQRTQGTLPPEAFERETSSDRGTTFRDEIADDVLRMIFLCNNPSLSPESRCCLTLHVVCGFGVKEIAAAYFAKDETIARRIGRAKQRLIAEGSEGEEALYSLLPERLEPVLEVVYLLFNEGYSSRGTESPIRFDLCAEALRLARLIASHPQTSTPEAFALLALICFQSARLPSRVDEQDGITLLEEQNRRLWDKTLISEGCEKLALSAQGAHLSRYHLEAGIASCHVAASDYTATDWPQILYLYDQLLQIAPGAIVRLNRLVALSMVRGVEAALTEAQDKQLFERIEHYYLYQATLADLYRRCGQWALAAKHYQMASDSAPGEREQRFFRRRLAECQSL